ncbi:PEP-CTERM sorting domain-containing protein [Cellvibrio zantedeschiae]|nr:PEP-CTERM sorting domain-containing protein [Cellvibrio zantedeschiae]
MKYLNLFRFGLAAACLLFAGASQAAIYKIDFSAKGFTAVTNGTTPPQDPISGYITFQADTFGANIDAITDVSLLIDGHNYQANEINGEPIGDGYLFGGLLNKTNTIMWGSNDFWVHAFTTIGGNFFYASASEFDAWSTNDYSYTYSKVPEPSSLALLFGGLLLVCLRRAKQWK